MAHGLLDATIARLMAEARRRPPPGSLAPAGRCCAQAVLCEDLCVNGVLAAGSPLALSTWANRTGVTEIPPPAVLADWRAWVCRAPIDLVQLSVYAQAVYAATDACLAAVPDEAFDAPDGETPAGLLSGLLLTLSMRRGEIACLLDLDHPPVPGLVASSRRSDQGPRRSR
jgi:hypothetical protein